jgi:hypothetical protein
MVLLAFGARANQTQRYLAEAEKQVRAESDLPEGFWKWVAARPDIRTGLLAAHDPVHPGAAKNLRYLLSHFGQEQSDRYANLLLAVSIARQETNLETGDPWPSDADAANKKNKPRSGKEEAAVEKLLAYQRSKQVSLVEMVKDQQAVLEAVGVNLAEKSMKSIWLEVGLRSGTFPASKTPLVTEFLDALIARYETPLPEFSDGGPQWPLFPIDTAPWPLLMPLAETRPLDECEYVWNHFTGKELYPEGKNKKSRRIKTYGTYTWDYTLPERRYKKSEWDPGSLPRIVEDGGVCGRQSQLGRTTYIALGKPAIRMGQPGHSALITFEVSDDGRYFAQVGQSIAPMNKSYPDWPFNDAVGLRSYRDGTRSGAEYHYGLAMAMNHGLEAYMDSRIACHLARRLGPDQHQERRRMLEEAIRVCPYNAQAWYALAEDAGTDTPRINALARAAFRAIGSPDAQIEFSEERSATTDFNEVTESKDPVAKNDNMVALVVGMSMIEKAYPEALQQDLYLKEGLAFLQQELERQKQVRRSPYASTLNGLLAQYDIALNGIELVQHRVTEYVMKQINRTRKKGKLDTERISLEVDAVLQGIANADDQVAWLQEFRDAMDAAYDKNRLFAYNETKGKVTVDKTYDHIVKAQIKALRGKGRPFREEADQFDQAYQDQIASAIPGA